MVLALGSNLGDREAHLRTAIAALSALLGPLDVGPLVRSAPLSGDAQPEYLNTVVVARSRLAPEAILGVAKRLEMEAGRRPAGRWSSRSLDIDILLAGDHVVRRPELTLPHPGLRQRGFVLVPLARLLPDLALPPDGARVADLAEALPPGDRPVEVPWG